MGWVVGCGSGLWRSSSRKVIFGRFVFSEVPNKFYIQTSSRLIRHRGGLDSQRDAKEQRAGVPGKHAILSCHASGKSAHYDMASGTGTPGTRSHRSGEEGE